jgi:acylphosphatase
MLEKARAHIFISGLVQGVFFRAHAQNKAQELGLKGWIKNLPDGRVESVFEGRRDKVQAMIEWARRGSPRAQVDGLEIEWEESKEEFENFEVKY